MPSRRVIFAELISKPNARNTIVFLFFCSQSIRLEKRVKIIEKKILSAVRTKLRFSRLRPVINECKIIFRSNVVTHSYLRVTREEEERYLNVIRKTSK